MGLISRDSSLFSKASTSPYTCIKSYALEPLQDTKCYVDKQNAEYMCCTLHVRLTPTYIHESSVQKQKQVQNVQAPTKVCRD